MPKLTLLATDGGNLRNYHSPITQQERTTSKQTCIQLLSRSVRKACFMDFESLFLRGSCERPKASVGRHAARASILLLVSERQPAKKKQAQCTIIYKIIHTHNRCESPSSHFINWLPRAPTVGYLGHNASPPPSVFGSLATVVSVEIRPKILAVSSFSLKAGAATTQFPPASQ